MIRNHVAWSEKLAARLARAAGFRDRHRADAVAVFVPAPGRATSGTTDEHNLALVNAINDDGRIYLTQTRVDGHVAIRFQAGQFETDRGATSIRPST